MILAEKSAIDVSLLKVNGHCRELRLGQFYRRFWVVFGGAGAGL
jgi:hypothetical protein